MNVGHPAVEQDGVDVLVDGCQCLLAAVGDASLVPAFEPKSVRVGDGFLVVDDQYDWVGTCRGGQGTSTECDHG